MIGINTNPYLSKGSEFSVTHKYDIKYTTDKEILAEGDPLHIEINGHDFTAKFDNYYWKPESYEAAFSKSGFFEFRWVPMEVYATDG